MDSIPYELTTNLTIPIIGTMLLDWLEYVEP